mgnify:CR=1 FL=1
MQRDPKIVLFNAPPRAGKDTAALAGLGIHKALAPTRVKFSDPVKGGCHASYELNVPIDHYEEVKDTPHADFLGLTPRWAYIKHSESYMKPIHGPDVFGKLAVRRMRKLTSQLFLVPDSGFEAEALPVIDYFGWDNVFLVRIERTGCDFSNDSRNYLDLPCATYDVENNGTIEAFQSEIRAILTEVVR